MRLVCIADTHGNHASVAIPAGDVIIHAGDFCSLGTEREVHKFARWLRRLPHPWKIVVAGNHDRFFEKQPEMARACLGPDVIYLGDSGCEIEGYKFWGSPWTPRFGRWAFGLTRGEQIRKKWGLIPPNTEILITHGPPHGILDTVMSREHKTKWGSVFVDGTPPLGCSDLAARIESIRPRLHIFGHIHDGSGQLERDGVRYINASSCDELYRPINPAIVIDL